MELECTKAERNCWVLFTDDLKVAAQFMQAYKKANGVLGMINRVICFKSKAVLLTLYKSLVRSNLEYYTPAWSPFYEKDKSLLDKLRHRFTRMIPGLKALSYDGRLDILGLWSLEKRRNRAVLLEMFQMFIGIVSVSFGSIFALSTNRNTRGHTLKVAKHRS